MGILPELMVAYFLRHADAELRADSDRERKLTPKGVEQAEKVGKFFVRCDLSPELILTSPFVRARQTAKIVAGSLENAEFSEAGWLASGMTAETCLMELKAVQEKASVLLVGHEPDFSETIAVVLGVEDPAAIKVRKASLTGVELIDFRAGQGHLHFLVPARLM
jgi:phosphohistidine phosphatase